MDNIISILAIIDANLHGILRRVPITRNIYARTDIELKNSYLEHIFDIIEVIKDDEQLIDEMLRNIHRSHLEMTPIQYSRLKNNLKRLVQDINIEIIDNSVEYQNSGIMTDILVMNEYSLYFNDSNNLEMTNDNEMEPDNIESRMEIYQRSIGLINLFNMDNYMNLTLLNEDERQLFIIEMVNNTIKFIFFELFYEFLNTHIVNDIRQYSLYEIHQPRIIYGLMM
jgi:hypothetical protein